MALKKSSKKEEPKVEKAGNIGIGTGLPDMSSVKKTKVEIKLPKKKEQPEKIVLPKKPSFEEFLLEQKGKFMNGGKKRKHNPEFCKGCANCDPSLPDSKKLYKQL